MILVAFSFVFDLVVLRFQCSRVKPFSYIFVNVDANVVAFVVLQGAPWCCRASVVSFCGLAPASP